MRCFPPFKKKKKFNFKGTYWTLWTPFTFEKDQIKVERKI